MVVDHDLSESLPLIADQHLQFFFREVVEDLWVSCNAVQGIEYAHSCQVSLFYVQDEARLSFVGDARHGFFQLKTPILFKLTVFLIEWYVLPIAQLHCNFDQFKAAWAFMSDQNCVAADLS